MAPYIPISTKIESPLRQTKVTLIPHVDTHPMLFTEDSEKSWVDIYTPRCHSPSHEKYIRIKERKQLQECCKEYSSRAFFLRQKHSNSRLLISRDLYTTLVETNEIFDDFQDFVLSFGWKELECDTGPPPCRFNNEETMPPANVLGFEFAYGLRYVEVNNYGGGKDPWSVRQTAIYCKFNKGVETWVFISASKAFEAEVDAHLNNTEEMSSLKAKKTVNPFDLHVKLIELSLVNWRWYIKYLVGSSMEQSTRVVAATVGKGKLSPVIDFEINFEDRQVLKVVEDKALDLLTIFDSTADTINAILEEYVGLCQDRDDDRPDKIMGKLRACLRTIQLYKAKTETLCKQIQGTASLLSNLLDYENAKIAQGNGESLEILAQESREENSTMRDLTEKATNDAAAVKVITLITIIFLPTTVVSGFFSTQFVRTDGTNLLLTDNWWVIVAISLPLTIMTFAIWYCWIRFPWQKWWDECVSRRHKSVQNVKKRSSLDKPAYAENMSTDTVSPPYLSFQYPKSYGGGCLA